MSVSRSRLHRLIAHWGALSCIWLVLAPVAWGQALSVTIIEPDKFGLANASYEFEGTIFNGTGQNLSLDALFFDFSGFDPGVVSFVQQLGAVNLLIPAGTTSGVLNLFQLRLGADALPLATYRADVVLQTDLGDLSATSAVSVSVVPEPSVLVLVAGGFVPLLVMLRRRRR